MTSKITLEAKKIEIENIVNEIFTKNYEHVQKTFNLASNNQTIDNPIASFEFSRDPKYFQRDYSYFGDRSVGTNYEDIAIIMRKNIPEMIDFFNLDNDYVKNIEENFINMCFDLYNAKLEIAEKYMLSKASCRLRDIAAVMIGFYAINPELKSLANIGHHRGWSRYAMDSVVKGDTHIYTVEPIISNIEYSYDVKEESESRHTMIFGTTLHSNNFEDGEIKNALTENDVYKINDLYEKNVDAIFVDGDHTYQYCLDELESIYQHCKTNKKSIIVGMHDQQEGSGPATATEEFIKRHNVTPFMFDGWRGRSPRVGIFYFNFA